MKHFKEEEFKQSLQPAPWETAFVFDNVDDIVYAWEEIFNEILHAHCPWRGKRVKQAFQVPWITKSVIKQLHNKDYLLKVAWRSNNADDWANYRAARDKTVSVLR